eukprot:TRINITY_DN9129_c0_g1_i1.p1 TRINITY_DN9129_c0_g1~~TRINITY_DN9129_c0_g1_i1.p1  ORF type:complete len:186 (+),score=39.38 TRINITY_DN9129_c0_g1_i1:77-634(+)
MEQVESILNFFDIVYELKRSKRTGWVLKEVNQPESIADHMYMMAIFSMFITDEDIDRNKCLKLSIVHDMAESIAGDITPHCNVTKQEKYALEYNAMNEIKSTLNSAIGEELFDLWMEYETGESPEAKIVKQIDKLEMILQADQYEKKQNMCLSEFYDGVMDKFDHPLIANIANALYARSNARNKK